MTSPAPGVYFESKSGAPLTRNPSEPSLRRPFLSRSLSLLVIATLQASAQIAARPLITQPVDESRFTVLPGNTHPYARPEFDRGAAPAALPMNRMMLVLKRDPQREAALRTLIDQQQDTTSPNYHQWLTPDQFGLQFGASDSDIRTSTPWLSPLRASRSPLRPAAAPSSSSPAPPARVQQAFHTQIHQYSVNGELHWANSTDPSIPTALAPAVNGILTLHNFPRKSHAIINGTPVRATSRPSAASPLFTFSAVTTQQFGLGPTDFATIYNVLPLWNAGIDGTGQTIAISGESNILVSDIEAFRTLFGLPAKDPQVIVNGPDPGLTGDEPEAVLDVSWSGAVAKNATIDLVVSATTNTALGVDLSAQYIVDNNLAPVMSESYGECEFTLGSVGNAFYNTLWQQAAAQGITVVVAAGDHGSAGCDAYDAEEFAGRGLAVSGFASTPYNIAVGGTDFDQSSANFGTYWNLSNTAATQASAKSYIPETTWNQSCAGMAPGSCIYSSPSLEVAGGGGGPSSCSLLAAVATGCAGYPKPSWQTGPGVPSDGVRDLPDVSLFSSDDFSSSFYIMCEEDANGFLGLFPTPCSLTNQTFVGIGGTSVAAPTFAAILTLVNQKQGTNARQGNANYLLYQLAAQPGASCNSTTAALTGSTCSFYDITKGNTSSPCFSTGYPNCGYLSAGTPTGYPVLVDPSNPTSPAWLATPGYDLATGLGSVNAYNLVNQWAAATLAPTTTTLTTLSPTNLAHGQTINVAISVAPASGTGTPTGQVSLIASPAGQSDGIADFPLSAGLASGTTTLLPGGTYNVIAHYPGDSTYGPSDSAPVQVTVGKENSKLTETLVLYDPLARSYTEGTTVPYGSVFYLRDDVSNATGAPCGSNSGASCPSGSVTFTNNGTFALNNLGYALEDSIELNFPIGSYSFQSQYSGDNSFNPSSTTINATVTKAPTSISYLESPGVGATPIFFAGQTFTVLAPLTAESFQAAPTGTITVLENGNPAAGTITTSSLNGTYPDAWTYLDTELATSIETAGTYTYSASYPGDANYLPSQSLYPEVVTITDQTFNISTPIQNVTISAPGQSGTASVTLVSTDFLPLAAKLTCTLPAAMTEATCPPTQAYTNTFVSNTSVAVPVVITTTGPHQVAENRPPATRPYTFVALAGLLLFAFPTIRRKALDRPAPPLRLDHPHQRLRLQRQQRPAAARPRNSRRHLHRHHHRNRLGNHPHRNLHRHRPSSPVTLGCPRTGCRVPRPSFARAGSGATKSIPKAHRSKPVTLDSVSSSPVVFPAPPATHLKTTVKPHEGVTPAASPIPTTTYTKNNSRNNWPLSFAKSL